MSRCIFLSIICLIVLLLLYLPCLIRALGVSKNTWISKVAGFIQKKHAVLGRIFPVLIIAHALTSFSQIGITFVLGFVCLLLSLTPPRKKRSGKKWLEAHKLKAKVLAILVVAHVFVQVWIL